MALFGNQNKKSIEELENYYSGKQQRTGMAWMMAFLSLILTITVLGGLFLGGRWAYRTFVDDTSDDIAVNETSNVQPSATSDSPSQTPTPTPSSGGVVSDSAASTSTPSAQPSPAPQPTPAPTPTPTPTPTATAGASTQSSGLPNTGSGNSIIIASLLTFVISYASLLRLQIARQKQ